MKELFTAAALLAVSLPSFAVVQCPGNTNFVNTGDTVQQVIQQCGPPQKTIEVTAMKAAIWNYTVVQFRNVDHLGFSLLFHGNAVSKMAMTRRGEQTTIRCHGGTIRIGSTPAQVVAACGQPTHIQNITKQLQQKMGKITHLIYQPQPYLPETTFIFKNGALIGEK